MKRYLSCLLLLTLLLSACGDPRPVDSPTPGTPQPSTPSIMAIGNFQEFPLPQQNSGLMRPAVDRDGRIWFGEMNRNFLAVFDPHTRQFHQMTPPDGHNGIMGVTVAADNTIWFAEQYANYIGHYLPTTNEYQTYPLPTLTVPDPGDVSKTLTLPSAPNDIALDTQGNIWFTELNADALGRLDPRNGNIRQYPIAIQKSTRKLNPYGIAVDLRGMIWFTQTSNTRIGRLDPASGHISFFAMHGLDTPLMEIASDTHGIIWATSFANGLLLRLDPQTGAFTPYFAPFTGNSAGGLYGLTITPPGEVWITITAENKLARLDVANNRFLYYPIPTQGSLPLGLVVDAQHAVWFTEAGSNKLGMLQP